MTINITLNEHVHVVRRAIVLKALSQYGFKDFGNVCVCGEGKNGSCNG